MLSDAAVARFPSLSSTFTSSVSCRFRRKNELIIAANPLLVPFSRAVEVHTPLAMLCTLSVYKWSARAVQWSSASASVLPFAKQYAWIMVLTALIKQDAAVPPLLAVERAHASSIITL
jgi:hypothetical protein